MKPLVYIPIDLAIFAALAACATSQPETFILSENNETVICQSYEQMECGMALRGCHGGSVELECVKNVRYVGPQFGLGVPADYAPAAQEGLE